MQRVVNHSQFISEQYFRPQVDNHKEGGQILGIATGSTPV